MFIPKPPLSLALAIRYFANVTLLISISCFGFCYSFRYKYSKQTCKKQPSLVATLSRPPGAVAAAGEAVSGCVRGYPAYVTVNDAPVPPTQVSPSTEVCIVPVTVYRVPTTGAAMPKSAHVAVLISENWSFGFAS